MRFILVALLLAGCASPSPVSVVTSSPVAATPRPPTPAAIDDAGLLAACEIPPLLVDLGPLIENATAALAGEYSEWAVAAEPLNEKIATVVAATNPVPNRPPFAAWKAAVLEMLLHLSEAVIAYDTGMAEGTVSDILLGNEYLSQATDSLANVTEGAAFFSC